MDAAEPMAARCLARLPTASVLRSLFLSIFFTSPMLFKPGLAVFKTVANSKSSLLSPERNPLLRACVKPLIYDQFCAGTNVAEIKKTSAGIKKLGFSGVVLCYGKEVQLDANNNPIGYDGKGSSMDAELDEWREGNLRTLAMMGEGDWLGMKLTGAGLHITKALLGGGPAPAKWVEAMDALCQQARLQNARIWIDAEQQVLQNGIDRWAFDVMRRYNDTSDRALVYNTVQAYLKTARDKVQHQLATASREGWRSGIKLVRGAYISNDQRDLIHDTKAATDESYNSIVEDLLHGKGFDILEKHQNFEHDLLLAGHNTQTIRGAARMASSLRSSGKLKVVPEFGQLQGMADDIGCELIQSGEDASRADPNAFVPKVYKCLTWGSVHECMQYLTRRLVENRGAADRMQEGAGLLRRELLRRIGIGSG
jgi:proline dehydrogenase